MNKQELAETYVIIARKHNLFGVIALRGKDSAEAGRCFGNARRWLAVARGMRA